jgi:mono/diheme cytochrome c family protein
VHNTYFTLPVLIAMLSNHYGWLYQGPHNWLVLVLLMLAGALIRHSFVVRHKALCRAGACPGNTPSAARVLLGLAIWLAPAPPVPARPARGDAGPGQAVVDQRCVLCHNAQVQQKNVALHTPELIAQHAQAVYQQVVVLKAMPLNNATQITDAERALIKRWFEAGASPCPAPASATGTPRASPAPAARVVRHHRLHGGRRPATRAPRTSGRSRQAQAARGRGQHGRQVVRAQRPRTGTLSAPPGPVSTQRSSPCTLL